MGSADFRSTSAGKSAKEAFNRAVERAQYDHGHGGYTGTIAEKTEFVMIACPEGVSPEDHVANLIEDNDERIDDKWGPAGCMVVRPPTKNAEGVYLFFGWASE